MTISSSIAASRPLSAIQPPIGASGKKSDQTARPADARPTQAPEQVASLFQREKAEAARAVDAQPTGTFRAQEAHATQEAPEPRVYNDADRKALLAAWGSSPGEERFAAEFDLNNDGRINASDLAALLGSFKPTESSPSSNGEDSPPALSLEGLRSAWGTQLGESGFDPNYDFNNDGIINSSDLAEYLGGQFGQTESNDPASDVAGLLAAFGAKKGEEGFDSAYDHDGDGRISSADLAQILGDRGAEAADALRQNQLQRLLEAFGASDGDSGFEGEFDFDGDGRISSADLAEFLGRSA